MRNIFSVASLLLPITALLTPLAEAHKVIGIADGDTMTVLVGKKPVKIRLANIDAPEKAQTFGQRSKQSLSDICWGKDAQFDVQNQDRYGRTVAVVRCGGIEANRSQVQKGMAWVYPNYNKDAALPPLEQAARGAKAGLWSDPHAQAPWDFRHRGKSTQDATCHVGPQGGRYQLINGKKRYGC
ncbi:thermonuclease family protein [Herbaspirillum sp. alder98]|uniref:thermonuclease family protein n=1 Tax=Herbaspirillum sp. alder98 TaxID=2913096 RepID=UPI001CD8DFDC|nr:thermonuclease family protein [Herbaspirillum sp. alder98]MCA1322631.1 thermonuclease family protein [Herbaspirillum sp. alder98]